ncbi:hypothetical protein BKA70DRAFT_1240655 [Coprinopsis sp. MPI-PUGE-AT-0042]|nr:hypothetical protein BKA70DRAFT_1240655 [Coprinopsis sp. MPI-PUGE-AT-0042]
MFSKAPFFAFVFASTLGLVQAAPVALSRRQVNIIELAQPDVIVTASTIFDGPVVTASTIFDGPVVTASTIFDGPVVTASTIFNGPVVTASTILELPIVTATPVGRPRRFRRQGFETVTVTFDDETVQPTGTFEVIEATAISGPLAGVAEVLGPDGVTEIIEATQIVGPGPTGVFESAGPDFEVIEATEVAGPIETGVVEIVGPDGVTEIVEATPVRA